MCPPGDRPRDHRRLVLVDDAVADERRGRHHFDRRGAAEAVGPGQQALRDSGLEHRGALDAEAKRFLAGLPLEAEEDDRLYVHASAHQPERWHYVRNAEDARRGLEAVTARIVLCGHVHQAPFKPDGGWADRIGRTWVFNAGKQIGPVPAHIVIDLATGSASWHSLMGEESLQLAAAKAPPRTVF